ncbi:MAG TPA: SDR family NAD(P)-dependent oxidoreductase [Actinophytocola sp.]|nr:SDR family NAD(P)-dependent oxidoreductase [Actinophytocola sp.]
MDIHGSAAVVTGAGVGSGLAIAERLLDDGARVALTDLAQTDGLAALLDRAGDRAAFVPADLTVDADVERVVDVAAGTFGGLSVLVNNAGGGADVPARFPDATPDEWTRTLWLNLRTPLLATQLALPHLRAAGGAVVNIGSTAGVGADPYEWPEYGAAKAGLIRASACLARVDGVRVNCVVPDWLATDRALAELAELPETVPPPIPLSRLCDAVVDLVRDEDAAGRVVVLRR